MSIKRRQKTGYLFVLLIRILSKASFVNMIISIIFKISRITTNFYSCNYSIYDFKKKGEICQLKRGYHFIKKNIFLKNYYYYYCGIIDHTAKSSKGHSITSLKISDFKYT